MAKRQWDESSFFEELHKHCKDAACAVAQQLVKWCAKQKYKILYGEGPKEGTLAPSVYHPAQVRDCKLFEIFTIHRGKGGYVLLASYLWKKEWPESPFGEDEKRQQLIANLNRLPLSKKLEKDADNSRPHVTLDSLEKEATLRTFMEVHDWIANQIRGSD